MMSGILEQQLLNKQKIFLLPIAVLILTMMIPAPLPVRMPGER